MEIFNWYDIISVSPLRCTVELYRLPGSDLEREGLVIFRTAVICNDHTPTDTSTHSGVTAM
jgi:hypothetical protein